MKSLQNECDALIKQQKSLLLATVSAAGEADISYAPYVRDDAAFYILVSTLASHTQNLLHHPQVSVLFIQTEAAADNLYARQRLTLNCLAKQIDKANPLYQQQLDALAGQFGQIIDVLRQLPDFCLFALTPRHGRFVAGFGQAFSVGPDGLLIDAN